MPLDSSQNFRLEDILKLQVGIFKSFYRLLGQCQDNIRFPCEQVTYLPVNNVQLSSGLFTNKILQTFDEEYPSDKFVQLVLKASLNIDIDILTRYLSLVWAIHTHCPHPGALSVFFSS